MNWQLRLTLLTCAVGFALAASPARADSISAVAVAEESSDCNTARTGGNGFTSASIGPVTCSLGSGDTSTRVTTSASGSWLTGDLSTKISEATGKSGGENGLISGTITLDDKGFITLPSGMTSANLTFGATSVEGTAAGTPTLGGATDLIDIIILNYLSDVISSSTGCLSSFAIGCTSNSVPLVGGLLSASTTVYNGELIELNVQMGTSIIAELGGSANASITVDPLFLTLTPGATFSSYTTIPGFLGGSAPSPVPEPNSFLLFGTGLLICGVCGLWREKVVSPSARVS